MVCIPSPPSKYNNVINKEMDKLKDFQDVIKLAEIKSEKSKFQGKLSFQEIIEKQTLYDQDRGNKNFSLEDINNVIAEVRNEGR